MEPESRKLVGESSTRRIRPRSNKPKSLAESPIAPRRAKKKTQHKKKADSAKFYSLGDPGILDQKEEKGKVYYLCNWADDPKTGESFPPSWVCDSLCGANIIITNRPLCSNHTTPLPLTRLQIGKVGGGQVEEWNKAGHRKNTKTRVHNSGH